MSVCAVHAKFSTQYTNTFFTLSSVLLPLSISLVSLSHICTLPRTLYHCSHECKTATKTTNPNNHLIRVYVRVPHKTREPKKSTNKTDEK